MFNVTYHTNNGHVEHINGIEAETRSEAIGKARQRTHGQGCRFSNIVEVANSGSSEA